MTFKTWEEPSKEEIITVNYFLMYTFVISGNWNPASSTLGSEIDLQSYLLDPQTPKLSICVYCLFSRCVSDSKHVGTINFAFSSLIPGGFIYAMPLHASKASMKPQSSYHISHLLTCNHYKQRLGLTTPTSAKIFLETLSKPTSLLMNKVLLWKYSCFSVKKFDLTT